MVMFVFEVVFTTDTILYNVYNVQTMKVLLYMTHDEWNSSYLYSENKWASTLFGMYSKTCLEKATQKKAKNRFSRRIIT